MFAAMCHNALKNDFDGIQRFIEHRIFLLEIYKCNASTDYNPGSNSIDGITNTIAPNSTAFVILTLGGSSC